MSDAPPLVLWLGGVALIAAAILLGSVFGALAVLPFALGLILLVSYWIGTLVRGVASDDDGIVGIEGIYVDHHGGDGGGAGGA